MINICQHLSVAICVIVYLYICVLLLAQQLVYLHPNPSKQHCPHTAAAFSSGHCHTNTIYISILLILHILKYLTLWLCEIFMIQNRRILSNIFQFNSALRGCWGIVEKTKSQNYEKWKDVRSVRPDIIQAPHALGSSGRVAVDPSCSNI